MLDTINITKFVYTSVYKLYKFVSLNIILKPPKSQPVNLTKSQKYDNLYTLVYTNFMEGQNPTSQDNSQKPKEMIRVSISEAARLFGVNAQTIRRAIASQEITYVIVAGRYKVNFESLVKWSQHHTTVKNKLAKKGIGQFVEKWKIKNPLYSPNPKSISKEPPAKESPAKEKTTS